MPRNKAGEEIEAEENARGGEGAVSASEAAAAAAGEAAAAAAAAAAAGDSEAAAAGSVVWPPRLFAVSSATGEAEELITLQ